MKNQTGEGHQWIGNIKILEISGRMSIDNAEQEKHAWKGLERASTEASLAKSWESLDLEMGMRNET